MSHNFVLLEQGADADAFARASLVASDNEYIAPSLEDQVIIHTSMLGNGESDTITFTAPEETGEHTFLCSFPGHRSEEHTSELQSRGHLVCRPLLAKNNVLASNQ